jgi:hypothetical protein
LKVERQTTEDIEESVLMVNNERQSRKTMHSTGQKPIIQ